MATNVKVALAQNIATTKSEIENKTVTLKSLTDSLIKEVGEDGETFPTELGDVQVTQQTYDRLGSDLVVSFNMDKYHSLDTRTKNRLEALGLVTVERKMIKGQAPKVVVRLK